MTSIFKFIGVLLFAALLTGCASNSVRMIARRNSPDAPTTTDGIVLAKHPQPRPEDQRLNSILSEVLKRDGLNAKSGGNADYTLAYWIDESWDEVVPAARPSRSREPIYVVAGNPNDPTEGRAYGEPFHQSSDEERGPKAHYISTKGVKLLLYSNRASAATRLMPVWEGYIEVGSIESTSRLKEAVRSLLANFGKDFTGHVRLQK